MANPDFEQFMEIVRSLPRVQDLVFRGHPALAAAVAPFVTNGLLPASQNPRVASENFTSPVLLCIVSANGRVLGPLSREAGDEEVVILPGLLLCPLSQFQVGPMTVVVLDEVESSPAGSWVEPTRGGRIPSSVEEIVANAHARVGESLSTPAAAVSSPGKFSSAILPAG
ncbi:hypothetical protein [Agreia pratensis]|uniref:Uncharacterized protein n=1 Tax=Agreia pratensis TaxID=150121 RepID=A0A1X7L2S4_9MICO|nr:hypothetical protein [Agreia pratensis]SMG48005.1 hypothetical protein SAMN06296010_3244 [Agreia pratensis]